MQTQFLYHNGTFRGFFSERLLEQSELILAFQWMHHEIKEQEVLSRIPGLILKEYSFEEPEPFSLALFQGE
uniref:Uncharacterized protein n=1 Tax=Cyanothece sp. (strain PCC 7425 / ATCC 29141) TaxID=395961 RepID=B8HUE1_CYAP4